MSRPATGERLGSKLAEVIGEQVHKARLAASHIETNQRAQFQHDTMELLEQELATPIRTVFAHVLESPDTPEPMRAYFAEMMTPGHQGTFLLSLAAVIGLGLAGPSAAAAGLLQRLTTDSMKRWADVPLSPQEAATAVVKGRLTEAEGETQARLSGVGADVFGAMVATTGNPPGPETLVTMLNRSIITEEQFYEGIAQGLIRNEWGPIIQALRYSPMSVADAIVAEVEGHIDADSVKAVMVDNGVNPYIHDTLYATAGDPPGIMEMLQLFRRRLIDQPTMEQAIRESRIKDKYIPVILEMARHLMPERTIVSAVAKGAFTTEQGAQHLAELGFNAEDTDALLKEAHSTRTAGHKQIAESQVLRAYEDGLKSRSEAQAMIVALNYTTEEADFVLTLADHARDDKFRTSGINRVHTLFVSHHIDEPAASTALDGLGVNPTMRSQLLKEWQLERAANVPVLTVAEWNQLVKKQFVTPGEYLVAMRNKGYTDVDAGRLLQLTGMAPAG